MVSVTQSCFVNGSAFHWTIVYHTTFTQLVKFQTFNTIKSKMLGYLGYNFSLLVKPPYFNNENYYYYVRTANILWRKISR